VLHSVYLSSSYPFPVDEFISEIVVCNTVRTTKGGEGQEMSLCGQSSITHGARCVVMVMRVRRCLRYLI